MKTKLQTKTIIRIISPTTTKNNNIFSFFYDFYNYFVSLRPLPVIITFSFSGEDNKF